MNKSSEIFKNGSSLYLTILFSSKLLSTLQRTAEQVFLIIRNFYTFLFIYGFNEEIEIKKRL
jgi:hypothetical protein